eukprot:1503952-Lingulodinium_polyedra.AAC.1
MVSQTKSRLGKQRKDNAPQTPNKTAAGYWVLCVAIEMGALCIVEPRTRRGPIVDFPSQHRLETTHVYGRLHCG